MFSPRGKEYIWLEDVKNVRGILEEKMMWMEFEKLFRKEYLLERYYDDRVKELYELKMGSMANEDYTSRFLELLRYVPYFMENKVNIHRFISGLAVAFKKRINFYETRSLEEAIKILKHCYKRERQS